MLLIPNITDPLEEEQRQDVALPIRPIHRRATQNIGSFPEMGLQCLQSNFGRPKKEPSSLTFILDRFAY